ncbi:hypothetical protein HPB48_013055 [Haemaphysalis longicornis]|uniref:Uncharacterized protein n=1 Tax=Haemaphysalis longicornis TaxID=44386 RepID=A0A9J6FAS2_HAELO|nr:hypothetical protein HPB48_013055 [Haemaphysalis longicornis]
MFRPRLVLSIRWSRSPQLPVLSQDTKIGLRPREGLYITKISKAGLSEGVLYSAIISYEEAAHEYTLQRWRKKVSRQHFMLAQAKKYTAIQKLRFGDSTYKLSAYAAPLEDTVKGFIHNISEY